uniref:Family with sequence similarity 193 member B n=1 Tax=Pelodiscus sinensis TaxID=13735 RepID=K7FBK9_PELSI
MIWVPPPQPTDSAPQGGPAQEQAPAGARQRRDVKKGEAPPVPSALAGRESPSTKGLVLGAKPPLKPGAAPAPQREPPESTRGQGGGCGSSRPEKERSSEGKGRRGEGKAEQPALVQTLPPAEGDRQPPFPAGLGSSPQPKGRSRKSRSRMEKSSTSIDDVFLPKDTDGVEMDETDREVEYFKR